jgi:apolipoprotein N-acyltransferase
VKSLGPISFPRSRFLLAVVAGLLLAASFPNIGTNIGIAGLAWIAPGLMMAAALGTKGGESFRIGYVGGLAHYLASLYWLLLIPYRWHGIPFGPATGWLALGAFLALFPATWVWLVVQSPKSKIQSPESAAVQGPDFRIRTSKPESREPEVELGGLVAGLQNAGPPLTGSWSRRTLWALSGAAVWVALEMVLARILGGFPWNLLGVSQYRMVPLIQIASVTGVYGVSFLAVWFALSLVSAGVMLFRRPTMRSVWIAEIFLPMLVVAIVFNFGSRQLRHGPAAARTIKVAMVQPSIPQTLIWDETMDEQRFHELVRLSEQALTNHPDLLLWPEAAVPRLLRYDTNTFFTVTNLAGGHHAWMIIGADDMEPRPGASNPEDRIFFNSSFLVSDGGRLMDRYLKRNLVIFGEYIPLERWMPFLKWFTPIQGGFTPGTRAVQFELEDLSVKASVLICFEDVFPHLGPSAVEPDTDFLVNLTNDGWFGESAAQWQHAATAVFRTVENGVPLLRCTNTGLTCWVDAQGRMQEYFTDSHGSIYGAGFMVSEIPLRAAGTKLEQTFYNRHGDWFGWACVLVAAYLTARRLIVPKLQSYKGD